MLIETKLRSNRAGSSVRMVIVTLVLLIFGVGAHAQDQEVANKLQGFDSYMEQTLKDWNTPGIGVGVVINDRLVFAISTSNCQSSSSGSSTCQKRRRR